MANFSRFEPDISTRTRRTHENLLGPKTLFLFGFEAEVPTPVPEAFAPLTSTVPVARDSLSLALATVTAISGGKPLPDDSIDLDAIDSRFHAGRCACMACSGAGRSPAGAFSATLTGGTASAAATAPVSLQILANYLTRDFWLEAGTYARRYNLSSGGTGAKNGIITYNVTGWANDANGLSSDRQALTREVFNLYSATLGINFREVTGSGGDIRFTDNDSGAYAYMATGWYADSTRQNVIIDYSVVNVQASWYDGKSNYNTYTPQTIFHEIGHALGLGHQGQYNYTGTPLTYEGSAQFANDSWQATMMSYWDQQDNPTTGASFAWLQTPMAVDWIALNNLYGAQGYSTASAFQGDTIYGVGTNITAAQSQIWNLFSTYAGSTAHTIVDGSGYDTLNLSNFSANQLINLAPSQASATAPSISNIGGKIGNLTIAAGTIIEAAIGGIGNDSFYGNNANNTFRGGGGNDSFFDSLGSDIYYGDAGIDSLYFSESFELLSYALSGESLLFSRTSGSFDVDQVWNSVENIVFNSINFSYADLVGSLSGPPPPSPILYFTLANAITSSSASVMGGLTAQRNDIIAFDGSRFSVWLNGNASGLSGAVLRDFDIISPDEVVVAFQSPVTLAGIAFDDSDLARLSRNTSGGFNVSMFFDGSDVGLTTNAEAIDVVTGLADGSWLISTRGSGAVSGVSSFAAEDILRFRPTSLDTTTAGSWSLYADMSDVGITGTSENITSVDVAADGRLFLTTGGNASASTGGTSLSATNEDFFVFQPTRLGSTTMGSYPSPLFFDGSLHGLGPNALLGIDVPI